MNAKWIGQVNEPLICTPLVAKTHEGILAELHGILVKKPDMVEWRADCFDCVGSTPAVLALARAVKELADSLPVIFTIRSQPEGGQPTGLSADEVIELKTVICRETKLEYVDCELGNTPENLRKLRQTANEHSTRLIMSVHHFDHTPETDAMLQKLQEAEAAGADVAKLAVMPRNLEDVLRLLTVTLAAKRMLRIPVITVSMGGCGAMSRLVGGVFGSAVTFAIGESSSAPGQIPIEDLRCALNILHKAMGTN